MSDINDLLDGTLDDLADMPEFKVFPPGTHRATLTWDLAKTIGSDPKKYVEAKLTAIETVELPSGSEDTPLERGTESTCLFDLTNEYAQGKIKEILKSLAEHYGAKSNRALFEESNGAEVLVVTSQRSNKEKTKKYLEIVNLVVA